MAQSLFIFLHGSLRCSQIRQIKETMITRAMMTGFRDLRGTETINSFFLRANRALLTLLKKVATEKIPNQMPHSPKLSPQKQNATSRSGHSTLLLANGVHVMHAPI